MLRCPKCSRVYQDGTQRFCTRDGMRLQNGDEIVHQTLERIPTGQLPRLTAPGELVSEVVIMPPEELAQTRFPSDFTQTIEAAEKKDSTQVVHPFVMPTNNGGKAVGDDLGTSDYSFFKQNAPPAEEKPQQKVSEFKPEKNHNFNVKPPTKTKKRRTSLAFLAVCFSGVTLLLTGGGFAAYWLKDKKIAVFNQNFDINQKTVAPETPQEVVSRVETAPTPDVPVIPDKSFLRGNIITFNNAKDGLDGKLSEKFVGFSISYPNDWTRNPNEGIKGASNFIDLANRVSTGVPIEQILVSWYDSRGTFDADRETFPRLAKKLNGIYDIPAYKQVSAGAIKLNNYDAYQVRFAGEALDKNGEMVKIWGSTVFLPQNKRDARSGLLITILATSLAPALQSVEDVGEKGESAQILKSIKLEE
jgi:hypothetical protein